MASDDDSLTSLWVLGHSEHCVMWHERYMICDSIYLKSSSLPAGVPATWTRGHSKPKSIVYKMKIRRPTTIPAYALSCISDWSAPRPIFLYHSPPSPPMSSSFSSSSTPPMTTSFPTSLSSAVSAPSVTAEKPS